MAPFIEKADEGVARHPGVRRPGRPQDDAPSHAHRCACRRRLRRVRAFTLLRRILPRSTYHWLLYNMLPRVETWGPSPNAHLVPAAAASTARDRLITAHVAREVLSSFSRSPFRSSERHQEFPEPRALR